MEPNTFVNGEKRKRGRPKKTAELRRPPLHKRTKTCSSCYQCNDVTPDDGRVTNNNGTLPEFIVERLNDIKRQRQSKKILDSRRFVDSSCTLEQEEEDRNSDSSTSASNGASVENRDYNDKTNFHNRHPNDARHLAATTLSLNEFCLGCGKTESLQTDHPLFEGKLCKECTTYYRNVYFVLDQENKKEHCSICAEGGSLLMCDNGNCSNVFCQDCIALLDSARSVQKIIDSDPWYCYICKFSTCGNIRSRKDWQRRLTDLFKTTNLFDDVDLLPPINHDKKPICVLSVFDGIDAAALGGVVEDVGLEIGAYYLSSLRAEKSSRTKINCSEQSTHLGDIREVDLEKLKEIGQLDLLVGGCACSEKNKETVEIEQNTVLLFFEFYRILQMVLRLNNRQNQNTFWLFVGPANLNRESRSVIDRFLGRIPTFFVQQQACVFWGNIPGMYKSHSARRFIATKRDKSGHQQSSALVVKEILHPLRNFFKTTVSSK